MEAQVIILPTIHSKKENISCLRVHSLIRTNVHPNPKTARKINYHHDIEKHLTTKLNLNPNIL